MKFLSLQPFVPSGPDFRKARDFFTDLGFTIAWDAGDYVSFERDGCRFILQKYDEKGFAENFMLSVGISSASDFWNDVSERKLAEKYGIRISPPAKQPYGTEINIIDPAGVCWHFVEG